MQSSGQADAVDQGRPVLLYTDGLIERRGDDIENGIGRVGDRLARRPAAR